jgi:adenylyl cyclase-associated protein
MLKGKANAISIDNSQRLSLIVESLVSSVDVIKVSNFVMQVTGTLPTILMDQVDGAQVYLGNDSMNTEIFASKCSGINLNVIEGEGENEDYKENPLPEQIRTYIGKDGKIVSEIVEHAS